MATSDKREVLAYPPTAILTSEEVAQWLGVSPRVLPEGWHTPPVNTTLPRSDAT